MNSFVESIKQYYLFLQNEYGYSVKFILYKEQEPWSDGIITYFSAKTIIEILKDRDSIEITIQPAKDPIISRINVRTILEAINVPEMADNWKFINQEEIENKISKYAQLLRKYCLPEIKGDFARWRIFYERKMQIIKEMNRDPASYKQFEEYLTHLG
jgi:hypothetical protein